MIQAFPDYYWCCETNLKCDYRLVEDLSWWGLQFPETQIFDWFVNLAIRYSQFRWRDFKENFCILSIYVIVVTSSFRWISDSVNRAVAEIACFSRFSSTISPFNSKISPFKWFSFWHNAAFWSLVLFNVAAKALFFSFKPDLSKKLFLLLEELLPFFDPKTNKI